MGENIHYLSPLCISERFIKGYYIPDNHEQLLNLNPEERGNTKNAKNNLRYNATMYVYRVMKKLGESGYIMAVHQLR
jgi:hypothetical protein